MCVCVCASICMRVKRPQTEITQYKLHYQPRPNNPTAFPYTYFNYKNSKKLCIYWDPNLKGTLTQNTLCSSTLNYSSDHINRATNWWKKKKRKRGACLTADGVTGRSKRWELIDAPYLCCCSFLEQLFLTQRTPSVWFDSGLVILHTALVSVLLIQAALLYFSPSPHFMKWDKRQASSKEVH